LLKAISLAAILAQALFPTAPPGVSASDAFARATGNRKDVAVSIGRTLFRTMWPAQIVNVYADGISGHVVAGLHISGVHFHHALTRAQFVDEVCRAVQQTFAAAPVEEIDVWASVPIPVAKGTVVAGDLAMPTFRTVFAVSVRREEPAAVLARRIDAGVDVFWDQDWTRSAFKETSG
jgi:hypothetical protein